MKTRTTLNIIAVVFLMAAAGLFCTKHTRDDTGKRPDDGSVSLEGLDIEKKFLTEGFITSDLYRVVVVTPKDAGSPDLDGLKNRAKRRARVSIERNLTEESITCDRNTRSEILNLVESNGQFSRKDVDHKRYDVYYFDITKRNMKNFLRNAGPHR